MYLNINLSVKLPLRAALENIINTYAQKKIIKNSVIASLLMNVMTIN